MKQINQIIIENLIYKIRGKYVMMDFDLAKLYGCKNGTKTLNLAVKRHITRFPDRFMFQLTRDEYYSILRFQSETLKLERGKYSKYLPYAFTEEGIAMLATILKTNVAETISIRIMDAFVRMKKYISSSLIEQKNINDQVLKNAEDIKLLKELFNKFEEKRKNNEIFFNGQIYDAYFKIYEIFNSAKKYLIIIDTYADNTILDIIKRLNIKVTIITKKDNLLTKQDIEKYNKQYHNLKVIFNNTFHDRYFIIDDSTVYHCGTSINRVGYKTFSINRLEDDDVIKSILDKVNSYC